VPRALAIFAALCLLAALGYAFWPDGSSRGLGGDDSSTASAASGHPGGAAASASGQGPRTQARPDHAGEASAAPGSETPDAAEGTLQVEVQARQGPLAGARVRLYRRGNRDPNTNHVAWTALGAGVTGKDGRVSFRAATGRYVVVAEATGAARASKAVSLPAGDAVTRVELALGEPRVLNGRVQVKRTHEPVPLADVTLVPNGDDEVDNAVEEMPPEERLTLRADEKGAFRFRGLSAGPYLVVASAPGYGKDEENVKLPRAEDLVLELAPAGVLEGYVLGSDGKPSVGAEVMVIGREEPISVTTGAGGGFSVEVLPGTYKIQARKGGEAGALPSPVAVAARTTARGLVVKMGKAAAIAGDVVRKSTGKPVAGATVDVSPYLASGDSGRAVTDDEGHFAVNSLAPGAYDVVTRANGLSESLERGITVTNGDQYTLHVELLGTASVEGTVTDGSGGPIQGAVVIAQPPLGDSQETSAKTDAEGKYRIEGVAVGRVQIQAGRAESGYQSRTFLSLSEGDVGHADFTLPETSSVEGRLVAKVGGAPRLQFQVRLYQTARREAHDAEVNDEDGTFHADVPPGDYRAVAYESTGSQRGPLASASVKVEAGKTARVELVVDDSTLAPGASVLVLEPGGVPSPGAQVWATRGGRPFRMFMADETGHAALNGLGKMDGVVLKAWNGGRTGEVPYPSGGGEEITLQLRAAAAIHGRVTAGGAPVAGFTVDVDPAEWRPGGSTGVLAFPGSEFQVADLAAEPVVVRVVTSDGRKGTSNVTLGPGQTSEVTVSLDTAALVRARVMSSAGKAVRGAQVISAEEDRELGRSGPDGRVALTSLKAGSDTLHFEAEGFLPEDRRVEITTGQAVDLGDVVLRPPEGG
jgi:carboxypeptidase family protein